MTDAPPAPLNLADHGGDLDRAIRLYGGTRAEWIDLSTGINPRPYPMPPLASEVFTRLPDASAFSRAEEAARRFWHVPDGWQIVLAPGASAIIAALPHCLEPGTAQVLQPSYNEHARAFRAGGWEVEERAEPGRDADVSVIVSPNNPDGRTWRGPPPARRLSVVDESFADVQGEGVLLSNDRVLTLKSFGKFWGLAGLRLGAAVAPDWLADTLRDRLGPWAVSGPALEVAAQAWMDERWAEATRTRTRADRDRVSDLMAGAGAELVGGTGLFTTYAVPDAASWQAALARHRIWTRIFPYSERWIRLGLPDSEPEWSRLTAALKEMRV